MPGGNTTLKTPLTELLRPRGPELIEIVPEGQRTTDHCRPVPSRVCPNSDDEPGSHVPDVEYVLQNEDVNGKE